MLYKNSVLKGVYLLLIIAISSPVFAWERLEQLPVPPARELRKFEEPAFNQAVKLMVAGNQGAAKEALTPLAETGVVDAQVALASLFGQLSGDPQRKQSYRYSYFAAHGGNWNSQITTSNAFRDGIYTEKDFNKARHWLKRAAVKAEPDQIQYELEALNGKVLDNAVSAMEQKQYDVAERLLQDLAGENVAIAQEKLAGLYKQGFLGEKKKKEAESWYRKAADAGSQEAQFQLAMEYLSRPSLASEKRDEAIRMLEQAATPGKADAQYQLGLIYLTGKSGRGSSDRGISEKGVSDKGSSDKGIFYYRMAAEQGHVDAQYTLGVRYVLGEGVPKNDYEAHRWFKAAADQGVPKAMHNLALTYLYGMGTSQDQNQAEKWFRSASRDGVKKSTVFLNQAVFDNSKPKIMRASVSNVVNDTNRNKPSAKPAKAKRKQKSKHKNNKPLRKYQTVKGADWFLNLPVKGYTIQVLSARNASSVNSFFDVFGIKKKDYLHYIDNTVRKPLHVIQYGYFRSKKQALKAARKMAKGNKGFKPWVRDVKTIRNKIVSL